MTGDGPVVVVVAYGPPDPLGDCLGALGGGFPVVVVDNSSSAATAAVAGRAGARYLDPGRNLGFAAGVNLALAEAGGRDVLLLNPDAAVEPAVVRALAEALAADPGLACVGPAQRLPGRPPGDPRWAPHTPGGAWAEALRLRRRPGAATILSGAVLLLRGAALAELGPLDQRFFLYAEDEDWQRRAVAGGWRLGYRPELCATHRPGGTEGDPARFRLRLHAATEQLVRKWHGPAGWASYRAAVVTGQLLRAGAAGGPRRRSAWALARLYLAGPLRRARQAGAVPPPA